ncbi:MAG: hypothetical protein IJE02_04565 [Clostridia bacterium]|nr:hypothetical protein [Clostridia bacterium]
MNNDFGKISKEDIDAARKGNTDAVMSKLSDGDRKKINEVLADKEKLQQILNSDAAQKLMKILGGKQNG